MARRKVGSNLPVQEASPVPLYHVQIHDPRRGDSLVDLPMTAEAAAAYCKRFNSAFELLRLTARPIPVEAIEQEGGAA